MANLKQAIPFFMVTNIDRSIAFYVQQLGFEIKLDWKPAGRIEWCSLEREGVAIMLQEYRAGLRPEGKLGQGVTICFICTDALALYDEFLKKGLQPAEPFVGNNMWVVSLTDPDGYRLDFESVTEVPEETTYTSWMANRTA